MDAYPRTVTEHAAKAGVGSVVYPSEEAAAAAAAAIEDSWWNRNVERERYVAVYSVPRGGWIVRPRPFMPGTCT